jgi:hypothetical protein
MDSQDEPDVQTIVQQAISEYMRQNAAQREPAFKAELRAERKHREQLEKRLNEMAEETKSARAVAEEAQRGGAIRSELLRLGVVKVDLVFRLVQDRIERTEDGQLTAGSQPMNEYLAEFLDENPEFLLAGIARAAGKGGRQKIAPASAGEIDLDRIGPGMSRDELERVREEIVRIGAGMG